MSDPLDPITGLPLRVINAREDIRDLLENLKHMQIAVVDRTRKGTLSCSLSSSSNPFSSRYS